MIFEKAIQKIDNLDWKAIGTASLNNNDQLAYEFFRRMAVFFKEQKIEPISPRFANISGLLGDTSELIDIQDYCNPESIKYMKKYSGIDLVCSFYLQLARYSEENIEYSKYLSVYEPLLKIIERKGVFIFRVNEMEIVGVSYIPLGGWYDRFINIPAIKINSLQN